MSPLRSAIPKEFRDGQPIPLLEDVFRAYPRATINIDCKVPEIDLVDKVIGLVRKHNRQDRTILGSFADWTSQQIRERAPDIPRILSGKESALLYLAFFFGALPFVSINADYLEVPLMTDNLKSNFWGAFQGRGGPPASCCKSCLARVALWLLGFVTSRRSFYWVHHSSYMRELYT